MMRTVNSSRLKELVDDLSKVKAPSPPLTFSACHLFFALECLSKNGIGRGRLAERLALGNGAIRTILRRLVTAGLVVASPMGCSLSIEGRRVWREFEVIFPKRVDFFQTTLTPSKFNFAFLVRGRDDLVIETSRQRGMVVDEEEKNSLILFFRNGSLYSGFGVEDIEVAPKVAALVSRILNPQENDVVVIVGDDTALKAKYRAFNASWSLLS